MYQYRIQEFKTTNASMNQCGRKQTIETNKKMAPRYMGWRITEYKLVRITLPLVLLRTAEMVSTTNTIPITRKMNPKILRNPSWGGYSNTKSRMK
jgi:hypothetical protein